MGFFDKVVEFTKAVQANHGIKATDISLLPVTDADIARAAGREPAYGDQELLSSVYERIIWVYRCVSVIAENIARLPMRVVMKKGDDEVDISDLKDFDLLLRNPNNFQTRYDFMVESISRLELQGEMFWRIQYADERLTRPEMIFADWRSDEVEIIPDPEKMIAYFVRRVNGREYRFTPEEVFFVRFFNPRSVMRGLSPLHPSTDTVILEANAVNFNKKFFKEGMKFSGVFSTDQTLQEQEAKRLKEKLMEMYAGNENMWQAAVLWGGLKFQPLNDMSLSDAEFSTLRTMNREEIAAAFGVPLEVLGIGKATYENLKFARKLLWSETLVPLATKLAEAMTKFLLPRLTGLQGVEVQFDFSEIEALREDEDAVLSRYAKGFEKGAVTPNEIRQYVFGFDPIPVPEMNSVYLPPNLLPIATVDTKMKGNQNGNGQPDGMEKPIQWVSPYTDVDDV